MIFNILLHNPAFGPRILVNKTVLDVFAGTGALGLEALSRGAKSIFFIENNKETLPILYANTRNFSLSPSCIIEQDAHNLNISLPVPFDLIFLDPPYNQNLIEPSLMQLFSKGLLAKGGVVVIEMGSREIFLLPPFLTLATERQSGAAKVLFCSVLS